MNNLSRVVGMVAGPATTTRPAAHRPVAGEGLDPAAVTALQSAANHGVQPWRLDPRTTALAFTRGRFGWMMPLPWRSAPNTVLVDDGAGSAVSLDLVQPDRTGPPGSGRSRRDPGCGDS